MRKNNNMKWLRYTLCVLYCTFGSLSAQETVSFLFGDMDRWVVREIHESAIIGGQTKYLYEVGPTDTVVGNIAYKNRGNSPWANSNVMALSRRMFPFFLKSVEMVGVPVWKRAWKR